MAGGEERCGRRQLAVENCLEECEAVSRDNAIVAEVLVALEWFEVRVDKPSDLAAGDLIGAGASQQDCVVGGAQARSAAPDAAAAR